MLCGDLEGLGGAPEGGDICVLAADSCRCTAETNTRLLRNYTPMKKKEAAPLYDLVWVISPNQPISHVTAPSDPELLPESPLR